MTTADSTITEVDAIDPVDHKEAMQLQRTELERTIAMLRTFADADWAASTDCPDWDVRAMFLHVLGASEAGASMRQNLHQLRAAYAHRRRHGGPLEAALSNVQVRERADLQPSELVEKLAEVAPRTIRGRNRIPAPARRFAKLAIDGPVHEKWRLGYLVDVIYLRDMWMHRVDASIALERPLELSADHDGRIVEDVVAEWARRHGRPFRLELTGPAGGVFAHDAGAPEATQLRLDAVEFCRTVGGRVPAEGLLATVVPF